MATSKLGVPFKTGTSMWPAAYLMTVPVIAIIAHITNAAAQNTTKKGRAKLPTQVPPLQQQQTPPFHQKKVKQSMPRTRMYGSTCKKTKGCSLSSHLSTI